MPPSGTRPGGRSGRLLGCGLRVAVEEVDLRSQRYSGSRASCDTRTRTSSNSALRDWRAVLTVMGDGPYFFGDEPTGIDAVVFGALATSVLTPIESPISRFPKITAWIGLLPGADAGTLLSRTRRCALAGLLPQRLLFSCQSFDEFRLRVALSRCPYGQGAGPADKQEGAAKGENKPE